MPHNCVLDTVKKLMSTFSSQALGAYWLPKNIQNLHTEPDGMSYVRAVGTWCTNLTCFSHQFNWSDLNLIKVKAMSCHHARRGSKSA